MGIRLSKHVRNLSQSATMAVSARAKEMKREGINVIDLSAGEPDFPTPDFVKSAGAGAIENNRTKYTPAAGIPELRAAVAAKLGKENGLEYTADSIIVTAGAKQAVFNAAFCLFQDGDEVLIPSPYWVSYPEIVNLTGAEPVIVGSSPEKDFKVTAGDIEKKITERTRGLILNSPNNPSGAVYSADELGEIGTLCAERGIWVISDEIYERIVYEDGLAPSVASVRPDVMPLAVVVNGLSKTLSMTGWRIGYAAADPELVKAMIRLQSHTTSCVSSISQTAALTALQEFDRYDASAKEMVVRFDERRRYLMEHLIRPRDLTCTAPQGAFYLFFDLSPFYGKQWKGGTIGGSLDMCSYLLEEGNVALVPGVAFGEDSYIRLSYAASLENIEAGTQRILSALDALE